MATPLFVILLMTMSLSSCFNLPLSSKGKVDSGNKSAASKATSSAVSETKEIATVDPDSKVSVQLTTPKVQGLTGASVSIRPGSLAISASLIVEQATDFGDTSIASEMGLGSIQVTASSPGMIIRPSENVDLKKPLSLAMPLPTGTRMRLAEKGSNFAIFYKSFDPSTQTLIMGLKVVDGIDVKLSFDEASGRDVLSFEGYFGAYWATILSAELKPSEVPKPKATEEPITNKANVAVIENSGIVKESAIIVKQAVPEMIWAMPTIKFSAATRVVSLAASVPASRSVQSCKVDLFEAANLPSGLSFDSPRGPSFEYKVAKTSLHSLVGRFRCLDDQARLTLTPWSEAVTIPSSTDPSGTSNPPGPPEPPAGSGVCSETNPAVLWARGYEDGVYKDHQKFNRVSACKYTLDAYVEEGGNVYIQKDDYSYTCGSADHSVTAATKAITCRVTTAAAFGGDYLVLPRGNHRVTLDFSTSEVTPTFAFSPIPCTRGDMYVSMSSTNTPGSFPITATNKMDHLGGCEFEYKRSSLPLPAGGVLTVTNENQTFTCGDGSPHPTDFTADNVCGESARFIALPSPSTTASYRIRLWLDGAAANQSPPGLTSRMQYEIIENCPAYLALTSIATGLAYDGSRNTAFKDANCSYTFKIASAFNLLDNNFRLKSQNGSIDCGGSFNGMNFTSNCMANPAPAVFPGTLDSVYNFVVQGDPTTGVFTGVLSEMFPSFTGGYYLLSAHNAGGYTTPKSAAFQEIKSSYYEKVWTPQSAGDGFFLAKADQAYFCGSGNFGAWEHATVGGSFVSTNCTTNVVSRSQYKPVGLTANQPYLVTMDERLGMPRYKIEPYVAPGGCPDDLHLVSSVLVGSTPSPSNKFEYMGNCNYSFTLKSEAPGLVTMSYKIVNMANNYSCGISNGHPLPVPLAEKSKALSCGAASSPFSIELAAGSTTRFVVKRPNASALGRITVQNMDLYSAIKLDGAAASDYTDSTNNFTPDSLIPGLVTSEFIWMPSTYNSFFIRSGNDYCGADPARSSEIGFGIAQPSICKYESNSPRTSFGYWPTFTDHRITHRRLRNWEETPTITVTTHGQYPARPRSTIVTGDSTFNTLANTSVVGGVEIGNPGGVRSGMSWTDRDGNLWMFGGIFPNYDLPNTLWRFEPASGSNQWIKVDGNITPNQYNSAVRPGGRFDSAHWYDSRHHRLYLFGGFGKDTAGNDGILSDLWYFDIRASSWHLVRGSLNNDSSGVYPATTGSASAPSYTPAARHQAAAWYDPQSGSAWLFAGTDLNNAFLNDLWRFDANPAFNAAGNPMDNSNGNAGQWAWIGGVTPGSATNLIATYPSGRNPSAVWFNKGKAYVFNGNNGNSINDFWVYDTFGSGSWSQTTVPNSQIPTVDSSAGVFSIGNYPGVVAHPDLLTWVMPNSEDLWMHHNGNYWIYRPSSNMWAVHVPVASSFPNAVTTPTQDSDFANSLIGNLQGGLSWAAPSGFYLYGGLVNVSGSPMTSSNLFKIRVPAAP